MKAFPITLPRLFNEMAESGKVRVFNSRSQLMKRILVDKILDHIVIQPGTLPSGAYHYKVLNSSGKLDCGNFVVQ